EESQESSDAERRRLDSVLSHMSDGVLATDRRGNLTIVNNTALQFLNIADEEQVLGKSILDVLKIRRQFSIRHLVDEDQDQVILDDLNEDLILSAYFS
ncbi:PAS domain-containing protein, partial [Limosilactobacillus fermentum]